MESMKREATIRIALKPKEFLDSVLAALTPEASAPPSDRFRVSVEVDGEELVLRISARDTASLRAALNSYLRWIGAVRDACEAVSRAGKKP